MSFESSFYTKFHQLLTPKKHINIKLIPTIKELAHASGVLYFNYGIYLEAQIHLLQYVIE